MIAEKNNEIKLKMPAKKSEILRLIVFCSLPPIVPSLKVRNKQTLNRKYYQLEVFYDITMQNNFKISDVLKKKHTVL